jgi:SAM-dependent methyltransferase/uncharacterized protein YbaR (Trm112 family)
MKSSQNNHELDPWFLRNLVCPRDGALLAQRLDKLVCRNSHEYPIFQSTPVMLIPEANPTHKEAIQKTFVMVDNSASGLGLYAIHLSEGSVDAFVQKIIGDTNSNLYAHLVGRLTRYPIPTLPVPDAEQRGVFLDVGCNWGRWCIAAAKAGYDPIGIDPSLEAILAAKRIAKQLGVRAKYLVADSRFLPFQQSIFDFVYSYSVFQHFDKQHVRDSLIQIQRVLRPNGVSMIQMLNKFGLRSIYIQLMRGFRKEHGFETRYWSPSELKDTFTQCIGPTELLLGSFFTQGQAPDRDLFRFRDRVIFDLAELLKIATRTVPFLKTGADNLFVYSRKVAAAGPSNTRF